MAAHSVGYERNDGNAAEATRLASDDCLATAQRVDAGAAARRGLKSGPRTTETEQAIASRRRAKLSWIFFFDAGAIVVERNTSSRRRVSNRRVASCRGKYELVVVVAVTGRRDPRALRWRVAAQHFVRAPAVKIAIAVGVPRNRGAASGRASSLTRH